MSIDHDYTNVCIHIHYRFNMAKSCIFHELIELFRDEESAVRIASLETLVDLLDFFEKSKSIILCFPLSLTLTVVCFLMGYKLHARLLHS